MYLHLNLTEPCGSFTVYTASRTSRRTRRGKDEARKVARNRRAENIMRVNKENPGKGGQEEVELVVTQVSDDDTMMGMMMMMNMIISIYSRK